MSASMITDDGESTSNSLSKRESMRQTLENLQSQSNSLLHLALQWKDLEEYFDSISTAIAKREEEIELKTKQIDWKIKYMKKKWSDTEERAMELKEMIELVEERCETVRQKEKCCDDDIESLRCKLERLREYKRELRRKFKKRELKLEGRELGIDNREHEVEFRAKKLNSVERELLERLQEIEERERRIELKEKEINNNKKKKNVQMKLKNDHVDYEGDYADIRFNIVMNGKDLIMFLNGRVNDHEKLRDEVTRGISLSCDPPKLVLDAIEGFYPEGFGDEDVGFDLSVVRKSCILLLEQLDELKARIKVHVLERAIRVAMEWKKKMNVGGGDGGSGCCLEVVGFLQLVATCGLMSEFHREELLRLFEGCARHDRAPELCRSLGFTDHVHDIIQNLVLRDQPFEAIRLIYAFQLVDIMSPVSILRGHLKSTFHNAEKLYEDGNASKEVQIKCINMKLAVLDSVVKCIKEYGLDSRYLVQHLEHQISKLQVQKRKCRGLASDSKATITIGNEELCISRGGVSASGKETCLSTYEGSDIRVRSPIHRQKHTKSSGSSPTESPCLDDASGNFPCLHAQTQSKRPCLASVVVAEDLGRQSLTPAVPQWASYQYTDSSSTSWSYGVYHPSPLPTHPWHLLIN